MSPHWKVRFNNYTFTLKHKQKSSGYIKGTLIIRSGLCLLSEHPTTASCHRTDASNTHIGLLTRIDAILCRRIAYLEKKCGFLFCDCDIP